MTRRVDEAQQAVPDSEEYDCQKQKRFQRLSYFEAQDRFFLV
jgi:hypothetical protein